MPPETQSLEQLDSVLGPDKFESAAETMRSVMDEMGTDEGSETPAEPATETETTETASEDRPRDEKGRFTSRAEGEGEAEAPEEGAEPPEAETAAEGASEGQETASEAGDEDLDPPHDWAVERQEQFRALPKEQKQFVKEAFDYVKNVYEQTAQAAHRYQSLEQVIAPRRDTWYRQGTDEAGAIRQLLAISDMANQQPEDFVQMFARERGLQPEQVFPQLAAKSGEDEYADPEVSQLKQYISKLEEKITGIEGTYTQQQREAQAYELHQLQQHLQHFASETDERGKPLRPYLNEVRGTMSALLQSGQAPDLPTAYDMAIYANPEIRRKIVSAERHQEQRERQRKEREKAEAARRAGTSISGTPGDRAVPEPSDDPREFMRQQLRARGVQVDG